MILALACAVLMAAAPPLADDIDFQEGKRLVDDLDYERAIFRFQKLTKSDRPAEERATVYAWLGATYANLGDESEAIKAFVNAIKLDPLVALPPSSPKVTQIFDKARQQVREEVRADSDGDGIPDGEDKCPTQAETKNGFQDDDGCPDTAPPADSDGDGITDDVDRCPNEPETVNQYLDEDGCPDTAPPPPPKGPNTLLIGGGAALGLGVIGTGAGVVMGVLAQSLNAEAQAQAFQDDRLVGAASAEVMALGANVAYVAGGGLVVVGGALMVMSLMGGDA
jgi:tetratricopeptide (TPR) repeat protein